MKKQTRVAVILIVLGILFVISSVFVFERLRTVLNTVYTAENVGSVSELPDWLQRHLPVSATNISYWKAPLLETIYEYQASEADFLKWAQENEIQLSRISVSTKIVRHCSRKPYPETDDQDILSDYEANRIAIVHEGYEYHGEQENGGGLHIVYDLASEKAYHDSALR